MQCPNFTDTLIRMEYDIIENDFTNNLYTGVSSVSKMYLMYTLDASSKRIYTLKVSFFFCIQYLNSRAFVRAESDSLWKGY